MQNFILTRVAIDSLIDGTKLSIQNKSISESMAQIEQARELIQKLKQMSTSDQTAIVARRESTIEDLAIITAGKLKKVPRKKANTKGTLVQPLGTS
jgi:NAD-dependent DNA ligase